MCALETRRLVYGKGNKKNPRTDLVMTCAPAPSHAGSSLRLDISEAEDYAERRWILRLHLPTGTTTSSVFVDGQKAQVSILPPIPIGSAEAEAFFPFGGHGTSPAPHSGPVVEVVIPVAGTARVVEALITIE
jgi:hypothetical protein